MDDVRLGSSLRVLRIRKHLRQADVARRAGVRRETVGRLERGAAGRYQLGVLRAVATALGADFDVRIRWQGADLDRIIGAAHAELHESIAAHLARWPAWTWRPEVSFSIWGERDVIDILAWHPGSRSLLIIELKTELADPQELVATMGRRMRLAKEIARGLGWHPASVSGWVIVVESSTNRRRAARHARLLRTAFPADGRAMRRWLRTPAGSISALSFWSEVRPGSVGRSIGQVKRVRRATMRGSERESSPDERPRGSSGPAKAT
jgi:transcriptional regulator with XRE-family HTH domain